MRNVEVGTCYFVLPCERVMNICRGLWLGSAWLHKGVKTQLTARMFCLVKVFHSILLTPFPSPCPSLPPLLSLPSLFLPLLLPLSLPPPLPSPFLPLCHSLSIPSATFPSLPPSLSPCHSPSTLPPPPSLPQQLYLPDSQGLQAVHYASISGMEGIVKTLVERGVDVEVGGEERWRVC